MKHLLSQLQEIADELDIGAFRIFTDECIFEDISINKLKELGNKSQLLKNLKIKLATPIKNITDKDEQLELIRKHHEDPIQGGHLGVAKTLTKLRANYSWKKMNRQVEKYIEVCVKCQLNKPKRKIKEELILTDTPCRPFEKISIDTIGPLPTSSNGNKYALTILCELTKYLIMAPMPTKDANIVAKSIFENLILVHGPKKQ